MLDGRGEGLSLLLCRSFKLLLCRVAAPQGTSKVGRFPVVVSLNGQSSDGSVTLSRLCTSSRFGLPGDDCGPCPRVSTGACHPGLPRFLPSFPPVFPVAPPPILLCPLSHCVSPRPRIRPCAGRFQNGQCLDLFPVPLPKPGFYEVRLSATGKAPVSEPVY